MTKDIVIAKLDCTLPSKVKTVIHGMNIFEWELPPTSYEMAGKEGDTDGDGLSQEYPHKRCLKA